MLTFAPKFVLVLMLAVLALLLFPADSGSFTATHGPTTPLRSLKFLRSLLRAFAAWTAVVSAVLPSSRTSTQQSKCESLRSLTPSAQLRC
ncbi:MAG: hypothetical protein ACM3JB_13560 [Acidobacteriaceae bacterium]